jgi:hypothetical protein
MSEQTPPMPTAEAPNPSRARRLAKAFESVFGQPTGKRSADQRLVLAHLRESCGRDRPIFQQDKVGNFDSLRAAHIDGAQTQYLIISRQLRVAKRLDEVEKPKAKVKR